MAWEISISPEGWSQLRSACHKQKREWLYDALVQSEMFERNKRGVKKDRPIMEHSTLADLVFQAIETTNTCDNGGHYYWVDSGGYYKVAIADGDEDGYTE